MVSTTRDPDKTRHALLDAAFWEMYEAGFQAASLDRILTKAGVTKGALYHHFRNKNELGYAVVDELIARWIRQRWVEPLGKSNGDAIDIIKSAVRRNCEFAICEGLLDKGCPLNNLTQEMSPLDEGFRTRVGTVFESWSGAIAQVLRRGQEEGSVRSDIDPLQTGQFIVATIEGMTGLVKQSPNRTSAEGYLKTLFVFLDSLRTPATAVA